MNQHGNPNEKLINFIIQGLKEKPAYLLIFGICVLLFLLGIGTGLSAIFSRNEGLLLPAFILVFLSFVTALLVSAYVIRVLEIPTKERIEAENVRTIASETGNKALDNILTSITTCLINTIKIDDPVFFDTVFEQCDDFLSLLADWQNGHLMARDRQYYKIMLRIYSEMKQPLFCTSILDYFPTWRQNLGEQILSSHQKNGLPVTRVFVFNNREEVTQEMVDVMAKQNDIKNITVRVYFDEEDPAFTFPSDISKDFSIVGDGDVIAVTLSFGEDQWHALWYFKDWERAKRFVRIRQALIEGSSPFEDFRTWWGTHAQHV